MNGKGHMTRQQYREDQMTPWFSMQDSPRIPGRYLLRAKSSREIFDGWYADGRWQIGYNGNFSPMTLSKTSFEWRGLNFDASPRESIWGANGVIRIT